MGGMSPDLDPDLLIIRLLCSLLIVVGTYLPLHHSSKIASHKGVTGELELSFIFFLLVDKRTRASTNTDTGGSKT